MLKPVDVFNSWALNGKDEGMQKNHSIAVDSMMQMLIENSNKKFSFIDATAFGILGERETPKEDFDQSTDFKCNRWN